MLKLVSLGSDRRPELPIRHGTDEGNALLQHIDGDRALVDSTQRTVARGRRGVVEGLSRVAAPATVDLCRASTHADLADRLARIHGRLLFLSAQVEMEMDLLDIAAAETHRLSSEVRGNE